jgi:phosphoribosyl 1,2-cyclic phosphodiesterase
MVSRFDFIDDKFGVLDGVAEQWHPTRPFSTTTRRSHFITHSFADHLALELGERKKDVQNKSAHRGRCIELLRHTDK